jgi:hypothetical protein
MTMTDHAQAPSGPDDDAVPGPARVTGRQLREQLADDAWLDELIDRAGESGVQLTGQGGFLPELVKAVLERGLAAELTDHLGYDIGTRPAADRRTAGTARPRKRCRARSGHSGSRFRGTGRARSSRGSSRKANVDSAASTT